MEQIGRFRFEVVEHTADVAVVAHGASFEEMLESAAAGMFAQEVNLETVPRTRKWEVSAKAESGEDLLRKWLDELVVLSEKEGALFCDFNIVKFDEWRVEAEIWGSEATDEMERTGAVVKAVTYHELAVWQEDSEWRGQVMFDV